MASRADKHLKKRGKSRAKGKTPLGGFYVGNPSKYLSIPQVYAEALKGTNDNK